MNEKTPQKVVAPRRRFFPWWWLAAVVAILVGVPILAHFYSISDAFAPPLIISKETTYITEPLTPEGLPDYAAWLNRHLSQGVTPENNAVVLLLKALGPRPDGFALPAWVYRRLGMRPLEEQGEYFVSVPQALQERFQRQPQKLEAWSEVAKQLRQRPWRRQEAPLLVQILEDEANRRPLELVRRASLRPRFFMPVIAQPAHSLIEADLAFQQSLRGVINDLALRAMLHLGHGRVEEAWLDLMTVKRLGRLLQQDGFLVPVLIGYAAEKTATQAALLLLTRTQTDEATARAWLEQWRQLPPAADLAEVLQWGERFLGLGVVLDLRRISPSQRKDLQYSFKLWSPLSSLDVNLMLRRFNQHYDRLVQLTRGDPLVRLRNEFSAWETEAEHMIHHPLRQAAALLNRTVRSELVVRQLALLFTSGIPRIKEKELEIRQYHLLVETGLALAVYRARCGRYPERLEELVPELLPRVPVDLFAPGQTLIYRREGEGYVLYSVGRNGVDDRGRPSSLKAQDDLGLRILPRSDQRLPLVAP